MKFELDPRTKERLAQLRLGPFRFEVLQVTNGIVLKSHLTLTDAEKFKRMVQYMYPGPLTVRVMRVNEEQLERDNEDQVPTLRAQTIAPNKKSKRKKKDDDKVTLGGVTPVDTNTKTLDKPRSHMTLEQKKAQAKEMGRIIVRKALERIYKKWRKKNGLRELQPDMTASGEFPQHESKLYWRERPPISERASQTVLRVWREQKAPRRTFVENTMHAWRRDQARQMLEDLLSRVDILDALAERTDDEEWLNEISSSALGSYILKAIAQRNQAKKKAKSASWSQSRSLNALANKRQAGLDTAYAKIRSAVDRE